MTIEKNQDDNFFKKLLHSQMIIPIAALLALVVFNLIADPSFFAISMGQDSTGNPVLSGQLAATGGQDISVGATIAVAGSAMLAVLCGGNMRPEVVTTPFIVAFIVGVLVAMLCGAFNGVMVAVFKVQPMVATLILYTAGRSIAAWINNRCRSSPPTRALASSAGSSPASPSPRRSSSPPRASW